MIKAFVKYLLSLCILLLSGQSQLFAHVYEDYSFYSSIKNLSEIENSNLGTVLADQTFITNPSTDNTKKSSNADLTNVEKEEEESHFSKKYLGGKNFFTAIICALVFGYFYRTFKKILLFWSRLSNITSYRYIIFQVFRI